MIGFIFHLLRKRRGFIIGLLSRTITERLSIGGMITDYLIKVEKETKDTVKFSGNVAEWVVKYIPPESLAIKGSVSEYSVKITVSETVKIGGLVQVQ